jgi:hypothetical protein
MFGLSRTTTVAGLGILIAMLGAFVVTVEYAKAPSETEPARVQQPETAIASSTPVVTAATTTPEKPKTETPKPPVPKPATEPTITSIVEAVTAPIGEPQATSTLSLNERVRAAVVNILCITQSGGPLNSISGSGVIVDPRGIIITNAHVAQYFLLKNYPVPNFVECTIRTGNPAEPKYKAELVFMPTAWITKNAGKINEEKPMGNGEHDYAFLRITGTVHSNIPMPAAFPYLQISIDPPALGDKSLIAGYPAGFLGGISVQKELYQASSLATVGELYTFETSTIDLFSIGGSIVAQQGSSGGAAADEYGILTGIIVTSTEAAETSARDLRALATSYIVRDFQIQSGTALGAFLSRDLAIEAAKFAGNVAPGLTATLINAIEHH